MVQKSIYRITFLCMGFLFLVFFFIFSRGVKTERFTSLNFDFLVKIQDNVPQRIGGYLHDLTYLVSPLVSVGILLLLTILLFLDLKNKRVCIGALLVPLCFTGMVLVEIEGKKRVESPAPSMRFLQNVEHSFPDDHVQDGYSYPSGHAGRAVFLAGVFLVSVIRYTKHRIVHISAGVVGAGVVCGICVGKVYLGHHWVSDIIGGIIVATAFLSFSVFSLSFFVSFRSRIDHRSYV